MSGIDNKKKKTPAERRQEKENAKRLLLNTNLSRVFKIIAGYAVKRELGEELSRIKKELKQLQAQVGSERGEQFRHTGPVRSQEQIKEEIQTLQTRETDTKQELHHLETNVTTITHADIREMFHKLEFSGHHDRPGYNMDQEIDRMIFECDNSMNGSLTFDDIKVCYHNSINDQTGLEPFQLFNLVQFLMYDEDLGGTCSHTEIVTMMVTKYGERGADSAINEMLTDDDDGEIGKRGPTPNQPTRMTWTRTNCLSCLISLFSFFFLSQ